MGKVLTIVRPEGTYKEVEDLEMGIHDAKDQTEKRMERKTLEEDLMKTFKKIIGISPPTTESLARFDQLLQDDQLKRLEELVEEMKVWDAPNTIPELKSFLYYAHLQPLLVQMLKDTFKYRDYLERFIIRFQAENETTAPQHNPQSKSEPATKLSAPIHVAVLQLNGEFLDWLLKRPNTDVNLRDSNKRTALTLICENYDQCMQSEKPCLDRLAKNRTLIRQLLKAGADFNICSIHMKLPFELLLRHCGHDETRSFVEECVEMAPGALAICSINDRNERVVGFYNNNPHVLVTVELLEIFLRCNDRTKFEAHFKDFKINETNVKKVIRLLLHTACDQNLSGCVRSILRAGGQHILKVIQPSFTQHRSNVANEQTAPSSSSTVEDSQSNEQEFMKEKKVYELEHRVELKGLLKKVCLMADLSLLQLFLTKISDPILLNDDPLLVHTLKKARYSNSIEDRNALLACAEHLATQETIHMSKKDNSGNTSLHLALKYEFDSIARLLLRQRYAYLGMRNKDNSTPLDYGTYEFWKNYFDTCIEVDWKRSIPDRDEIRFNLNGFYTPLQEKVGTNPTANTVGTNPTSYCKKLLQMVKPNTQPQNPTNTVTEMKILQQITQSKELKRLLTHPVLNTFIMVKWTRLYQWNYLNLLLTVLTIVFFGHYSHTACSAEGPSTVRLLSSILGIVLVIIREFLQVLFLGGSYCSLENLHDITIVIAMIVVLGIGCNGLLSSYVIICLAMQFTFLLGSLLPNSLATMMYMFKTVSINFLKSFLLFMPLISAFIYAFHLTYDDCDAGNCPQGDFNNFRTFWNATVKTLVMTTGEFDAAELDFEGGKMLLFIVFMFFAPIVILNLINGLAVSDIVAIREESELISISKKVMLLEQYERGVANVRPVFLKRFFPKPFFSEYQSRIHVKTKDNHKIVVHPKPKPKEQVKNPQGSNSAPAKDVQKNSKNRQNGSPKCAVSNKQNGQKASNGKPQNRRCNAKMFERPITKFSWLLACNSCNCISKIRYLREALFMYLDQMIVDEALVIVEKQNGYASHFASNGLPTTEVPLTPVSNMVVASGGQQHSKPLGSSTKQRIDKQSTQSEDDVLRELTDAKEQLKAVPKLQEQLQAVLEMQEHLKKVLDELMRCKEYQAMQKDVVGQDKQEDVVGQDKQEDDASK